jgi:hypothetical protein
MRESMGNFTAGSYNDWNIVCRKPFQVKRKKTEALQIQIQKVTLPAEVSGIYRQIRGAEEAGSMLIPLAGAEVDEAEC